MTDAQNAEYALDLLREVLRSPTNHSGTRMNHDLGLPRRYVAKRLDADLIERIRQATQNDCSGAPE